MNREKELVKNTLILGFGTFLPMLASLITLPLLTSYLSQTEYGIYDLVLTFVALLLPLATLKIDSAAFRFLIDYRTDEVATIKIISTLVLFLISIAIITLILLSIFLRSLELTVRILIGLYLAFDILCLCLQMITRGLSKNVTYSISTVINSLTNMLLAVLLVANFKLGLVGVLLSLFLGVFFTTIYISWRIHIIKWFSIAAFSWEALKEMISYSWPMVPNSLSLWAMDLSDRLIITFFLGVKANAIYAVAQKIPNLLGKVQSTFAYAWQESASLSVGDNDRTQYYSKVFDTVFSILIGGFSVLVALTPLLFKVLVKGDYQESYLQMPLLTLAMLFSTLSSFLGGIYIAYKRTVSVGLTTLIAAIINILLDLILVKQIGIFAGSISTLSSYAFLAIYRMYDVRKFQMIKYQYNKINMAFILALCMCAIAWVNNEYSFIINIILSAVCLMIFDRKIICSVINLLIRKKGLYENKA